MRRAPRALLAAVMPGLAISISAEVCREIREYERTSTTVANAYVLPLMESYLLRMQDGLATLGARCPMLLMMSSGGVTTVETARRFPVRLVESGPAGGAILARHVAARNGLNRAIAFDMGGTTAKITMLDDYTPQQSRHFEVARAYRFVRGSGIPVRIPVIDMVEIGAGGGSIARVDPAAPHRRGAGQRRLHARPSLLRARRRTPHGDGRGRGCSAASTQRASPGARCR